MLPGIPQTRTVDGPVGTSLKETSTFLSALKNIPLLNGVEVVVTFLPTELGVTKRVLTGLGHPPTGWFIFRGHNGFSLTETEPPIGELDQTVLYLSAQMDGTYRLWVF